MNAIDNKRINIFKLIYRLWLNIEKKRKIQLFFVFISMIVSGISELFILGTLIPFIQFISDPDLINKNQFFLNLFKFLKIYDKNQILFYVTSFFITSCIFSSILRIFNLWIGGKFSAALGTDISFKCYQKVMYQPYSYHKKINTSNIITLISKEVKNTASIVQIILTLLTSLIILIFVSSALFILNWKIFSFASICFLFSYSIIVLKTKDVLSENGRIITLNNSNQVKLIQESLGSIRDVILSRLFAFYFKDYKSIEYKLRNIDMQNKFLNLFPRYTLDGISYSLVGLISFLVVTNSPNNLNAISTIGVMAVGAQRLLPNFQLIYSAWATIQSNKFSLKIVLDYLDDLSSPKSLGKISHKTTFEKNITFKNIFFRYESDKSVLNGIDFTIYKGDKVGIIGKSGSGKTTILDLMTFLLKPQKGSIFVDDLDLTAKKNKANVLAFRNLITYVPQSIYLTDSTIAENIAFGVNKYQINTKKLKEVISIVDLDDFVDNHPDKYYLRIGERGSKLSGGQKQRIGIARALYKNPEILILDESTSGLDSYTERKVIESIKSHRKDITLIMITHRLSTIKNFTKILEIKDGKIIQLENS